MRGASGLFYRTNELESSGGNAKNLSHFVEQDLGKERYGSPLSVPQLRIRGVFGGVACVCTQADFSLRSEAGGLGLRAWSAALTVSGLGDVAAIGDTSMLSSTLPPARNFRST